MITVVGGVYRELVRRQDWDEYFGSAGRAAEALVELGAKVELHTFLDEAASVSMTNRNRHPRYAVHAQDVKRVAAFDYIHELARPTIGDPSDDHGLLTVQADKAVVYGLYAGAATVHADYAVYDPQNAAKPKFFRDQGSTAKHLAVVLNQFEAARILGEPQDSNAHSLAEKIAAREDADVVVMKAGPMGAYVLTRSGHSFVPSYKTSTVFKIGSGDIFVATFAQGWLELGLSPHDAADRASRATAFYVQERRPATAEDLKDFDPEPVAIGEKTKARGQGKRAKVYLAGPFFTMGQLWVVEEAVRALSALDMKVLSPYHQIGLGPADQVIKADLALLDESDLVLAIGDGMDPGTIFEVGYAKAQGKPVVFYVENEEGERLKIFEGSDCDMTDHFPTAIYRTVWQAMAL